jgi:hypothetical protein
MDAGGYCQDVLGQNPTTESMRFLERARDLQRQSVGQDAGSVLRRNRRGKALQRA